MSEIAEFTRHLGHYLPPPDVALVERAFAFSENAHQGQFRKSGEPYITHPLAVASILSQWRLDAQGLAAALLHDVMEDTAVTKIEIESSFGKPVAGMVGPNTSAYARRPISICSRMLDDRFTDHSLPHFLYFVYLLHAFVERTHHRAGKVVDDACTGECDQRDRPLLSGLKAHGGSRRDV
jgi:hypothetical protein